MARRRKTSSTISTIVREVREKIDNYKETVHALWAFVSVATWDSQSKQIRPGTRYAIGRRMTPPDGTEQVTPDLVIQCSRSYGIVAEAKRSLPQNQVAWGSTVGQIKRYDADLLGWWTDDERIAEFDIGFLIHQTLGPRFGDYLEKLEAGKQLKFNRPLALIEFNRFLQVAERMHLCLRKGQLRDRALFDKLRVGVSVSMERVVASYSEKRFYDAEPEPEHLLTIIWLEIVMSLKLTHRRDPARGCTPIPVSVGEITQELQRAYGSVSAGPRDPEYPRTSSVTKALEILVKLKLAHPKDTGHYEILYRDIKGDLIERFARHRMLRLPRVAPRKGRGRDTKTLPLF